MTSQPQSTISWNTPEFLAEKLQELYSNRLIQSYQYIRHIGEDGDKDHFHVRIVPNKRLDMMEVSGFFSEPDLLNPENKPLGCLDWGFSKQDDWLLYAIHEPRYMALKYDSDKKEKLPYQQSDVICSPGFPLELSFMRAFAALEHMPANIVDRMLSGATPIELVKTGENANLVRTVQSMLFQYHNQKEFEKAEKSFQDECKKRFALEDALFNLGYICKFDSDCNLTIEKIDV